jgi:anti-sigma factor ChrR (cupin superfamily)
MAIERRILNIYSSEFSTYDLDGPVQKDIALLNLSFDKETAKGCYVMRMAPGSQTIPHTHRFVEEYLILEGELIESDGTVLRKGDLVSYPPGSRHNSRTETGCLLIGIDWDPR